MLLFKFPFLSLSPMLFLSNSIRFLRSFAQMLVGSQIIDASEKEKMLLAKRKAELHQRRLEQERIARELAEKEEMKEELAARYVR